METFRLGWEIKNLDDLYSLLTSWPKLRNLNLEETLVTLSSLECIVENCPELRQLHIGLDNSAIDLPPSKTFCHNLEHLTVARAHPPDIIGFQRMLACQIKVTRHLNLIFPHLNYIGVQFDDVFWSGVRDHVNLCWTAS